MIASFLTRTITLSKEAMLTLVTLAFLSSSVFAAQTGSIVGRVSNESGANIAGVTIVASSNVLPQPRTVSTADNGRYKLALLPPGDYRVVYTAGNGTKAVRTVEVRLGDASRLDISLSSTAADLESVTVYGSATAADLASASLKSAISSDLIDGLPVGQQYRDVIKLIPGVQYSEDLTRGPSAGGSGQDNVYQIDGVDVSTPLFGTLGAEPSTHDIEQVSVVKGGASGVGFNRSGGFTINTISKSGTDEWKGEVSFQYQPAGFTVARKSSSVKDFDEDKIWTTASVGGPLIEDRLYFYGSYYGPTVDRDNSTTAYGPVGDFSSERDEYYGKLTYSPLDNVTLNLSHRTSEREDKNTGVGGFAHPSTSKGSESELDITIFEGSWLISDNTSVSVKYTDYLTVGNDGPDTISGAVPAIGGSLDIANLATQGLLNVPQPIAGETDYNNFIQAFITQYGYDVNGVATGGGAVGFGSQIDDTEFNRESLEVAIDHTLYWGETTHDLHFGYKQSESGEKLARLSNGWGSIGIRGGRTQTTTGDDIFFEARIQQMSLQGANGAAVPTIKSEFKSVDIELNDTIEWGDFTFNVGVLFSNDELYGQGLRKKAGTVSGFEVAVGNSYLMHEIDFSDMIQPRLGVTWDFADNTSVFANYATYNPAASSLPRAASWARNLRKSIDVAFDANGNFLEADPVRSSSGKVFQDGIEPRKITEYVLGLKHQFDNGFNATVHARYKNAENFWEDTNNTARLFADAPANIAAKGLYVPNLADIRAEIGGSSYVIAQLDDAETDYYEMSFEGDWRVDDFFFRASYVWSHYFGNFDQDNSTTNNDANVFIGSSLIADAGGRQLWNNRQGDLRGDRRHQFKFFGTYDLPWDANIGAIVLAQSGQPWEKWDHTAYPTSVRGSSTSDTGRYAEAAGSRTTSSHFQIDLNYTQNLEIWREMNLQLRADLYNILDRQTGYNINAKANSSGFGRPRSYYNPRRLQLAVKLQF